MSDKKRKKWLGTPPEKCDLCGGKIDRAFVDGKTGIGPWANMCVGCFVAYGVGLGTGLGQRYELDKASGDWLKVGG